MFVPGRRADSPGPNGAFCGLDLFDAAQLIRTENTDGEEEKPKQTQAFSSGTRIEAGAARARHADL